MEEEYLEFAKEIALEAGKIMMYYFNYDNEATYKIDKTIVTIADTKINEYLIKKVKEKFPTHCVCGEEESFGDSKFVWVCDPVDGTAMYARHIPVAVFSLALVVDGISQIGVVYDPFNKQLYSAIKGKGAYVNEMPIKVNDTKLGEKESVSNYDMWPGATYDIYSVLKILGKKSYFVSIGSVIRACMAVAKGEFNLAIFPGTTKKNCDIAAAKVIVEEAGGKVTNIFGKEQRYDKDIQGAIVSNGIVHTEVIKQIQESMENNKKM